MDFPGVVNMPPTKRTMPSEDGSLLIRACAQSPTRQSPTVSIQICDVPTAVDEYITFLQPVNPEHVSILLFVRRMRHYSPTTNMATAFMVQLVDEWLHGMGITNAQLHRGTTLRQDASPHCHLVFSRIDLDGNVISEFNERIRMPKSARK